MRRLLLAFVCIAAVWAVFSANASGEPLLDAEELDRAKVFHTLAEALAATEPVYRLDLREDRELIALPPSIGRLSTLQELILRDTRIARLPAELGQLRHLQTLDLQHLDEPLETFTQLPLEIGELQHLEDINLIGLPNLDFGATMAALSRLPTLRNVALMNNRLQRLPPEVRRLKSLHMIWLGKNPDLDLEDTFRKLSALPDLQQLGLGGNGHENLPANISELRGLVNLWLAGNRLTQVPDLKGLKDLRSLVLNRNRLVRLSPNVTALANLQSLSLKGNQQLDLDEAVSRLTALDQLSRLDLSDCGITTLPAEFRQLESLRVLVLTGNPLPEAELQRIRKSLPETRILF